MALHGFGKKLTWRDFKVVPESPDGQFDALTFVVLANRWSSKRNKDGTFSLGNVSVTISFDHLHSWVVKGKQTAALLQHEQAHYEIAAIAGRTIEQKLLELGADSMDELNVAASRIFSDIAGESSADGRVISSGVVGQVQDRYDEDVVCGSDHSRNAANQAIWQQRIAKTFKTKSADIALLDSCPRLSAPSSAGAAAAGQ